VNIRNGNNTTLQHNKLEHRHGLWIWLRKSPAGADFINDRRIKLFTQQIVHWQLVMSTATNNIASLYGWHSTIQNTIITSCGARHNKPRPCCHLANDTNLLTPVLWAMTGDKTNKLTFDPPTRLPELTQNLTRSSHGQCHSTPSLKISCKLVQPFSRNVADKETKKERKKERNRPKTIPRPPPPNQQRQSTEVWTEFWDSVQAW